jgi:predicted transcriptional regulator
MPKLNPLMKFATARDVAFAMRRCGFVTLTPSQLKVLELIQQGCTSYRDIARNLGHHLNHIVTVMKKLRKLGLVTLAPTGGRQARTMRPTHRFVKAENL